MLFCSIFRPSFSRSLAIILNSGNISGSLVRKMSSSTEKEKVVVIACGSFNPITFMHLRMMERAKTYLTNKNFEVSTGYYSPVSDGYGKPGLATAQHRLAMCELALDAPDRWLKVASWESDRESWTPTIKILREATKRYGMRTMLVCGSDFLVSFGKEGLWLERDVEEILAQHGLIVVARPGYDSNKFIEKNALMTRLKSHIHIVNDLVSNDLSSTVVRNALLKGESIKYLTPDKVIEYIEKNELYREAGDDEDGSLAPYEANKKRSQAKNKLVKD